MTPTKKRPQQALAEFVFLTAVMMLSGYLGMLLFSAFEPTLIPGVMRGLRIFLGVVVFILGAVVFYLAVLPHAKKPHFEIRFAALILLIGPLEYFGVALILNAFAVG